jgi:hypothetical protein
MKEQLFFLASTSRPRKKPRKPRKAGLKKNQKWWVKKK